MKRGPLQYEELLTTGEVALMFRVNVKAVIAWVNQGKLPAIRTPGGHRRIPAAEVRALLSHAQDGAQ